jgi:uncharacterized protein YkwD
VSKLKLLVLLAVFATLSGASSVAAAPAAMVHPQADAHFQSLIVRGVNAVRHAHRLPALRNNGALDAAAREHTDEMASYGYFSHNSLDGSSFATRITLYYARGRTRIRAGENLYWAQGDPTAESVIAAWAASAPHRANLLNTSWREIGVSTLHVRAAPGAFAGGDVVIITADFGVAGS